MQIQKRLQEQPVQQFRGSEERGGLKHVSSGVLNQPQLNNPTAQQRLPQQALSFAAQVQKHAWGKNDQKWV